MHYEVHAVDRIDAKERTTPISSRGITGYQLGPRYMCRVGSRLMCELDQGVYLPLQKMMLENISNEGHPWTSDHRGLQFKTQRVAGEAWRRRSRTRCTRFKKKAHGV